MTKEMGKLRFNCKNTILDIVKCFHRMGKHETRNCDKCGQIVTLEHVL